MESEMMIKFQSQGIKIEKTKSRMDVFKKLFKLDPSLLSIAARDSRDQLPQTKEPKK
ncbi:Lmo0850 family protein [Peribacillus sp. SCS-37]|uniref:Lmo0850 family protein n=1 Tax=Paraperibacillus esterisolvens TaxID=3115296 RepID=UPI0039067F00